MWFQKMLCSTSAWVLYCKFAGDLQNSSLVEHLWGLVLCFISFVLVQVKTSTFYRLAFIIRIDQTDQKPFWRFSLFYDIFFEIIFQMLAVIETPIISLFESFVKQMFVVIAEAVPRRCSSRKIIWSISVINVKRNNFVNNGQMLWEYYFVLFSFDQNLNSPKYGA